MAAAGASIVGGILQIGAQREAANERRNATNQALALEQQREAERQRRATQREEARRLAFLNYYDRYGDAAIDRYGLPAGIDPSILPSRPRQSGRQQPRPTVPTPTTAPAPQGLGALGGRPGLMDSQQPNTAPSAMPGQGTLGALGGQGDPFDWQQYGVR